MSLVINKNILLDNPNTKAFLADTYYLDDGNKKPLLIFVHGYKGYKDWGAWELMANYFANAGFYFVKFNFSHNGTTIDNINEFADLESFGQNNYTKEMSDLNFVINHFISKKEVNANQLALMAHSRGNGNILIQANEDVRVKGIIGLGGISDYASRFPSDEMLESIKKVGVHYIENVRTKQQMPHYYQFFEDFKQNEIRFNIKNALENIDIPYLIIHGSQDETVKVIEAEQLQKWSKQSELIVIEDANHGFGSTEPWYSSKMPEDLEIATSEAVDFLKTVFN